MKLKQQHQQQQQQQQQQSPKIANASAVAPWAKSRPLPWSCPAPCGMGHAASHAECYRCGAKPAAKPAASKPPPTALAVRAAPATIACDEVVDPDEMIDSDLSTLAALEDICPPSIKELWHKLVVPVDRSGAATAGMELLQKQQATAEQELHLVANMSPHIQEVARSH